MMATAITATATGFTLDEAPKKAHLHRDPKQLQTADAGLVYRVGSSVLNRLPLYSRIWRPYSADSGVHIPAPAPEETGTAASSTGARTPPPGYYDLSALTDDADLSRGRSAFMTGAAASKPVSRAPSAVGSDDTAEDSPGEHANTGYFPDTGTKRYLKAFGTLLKTLSSNGGGEVSPSDIVLGWLPGVLGAAVDEYTGSSSVVAPTMAVGRGRGRGHQEWVTPDINSDCRCFSCFQQRHMYLIWIQQHPEYAKLPGPPIHHHQQEQPSQPCHIHTQEKPLLHRITASIILVLFTLAFVIYPHVKTILAASIAWERRNRVAERGFELVGRVWAGFVWAFSLTGAEEDVDGERRVREWAVRAGGEVLAGLAEGVGLGVGVWKA